MVSRLILIFIEIIFLVTFGGANIGAAIKCFKKEEYGGFGVFIMIAFWMALLLTRLVSYSFTQV